MSVTTDRPERRVRRGYAPIDVAGAPLDFRLAEPVSGNTGEELQKSDFSRALLRSSRENLRRGADGSRKLTELYSQRNVCLRFSSLWVPALWLASMAALCVALFNHLYIWVHYYSTELPDMKRIYGSPALLRP